MHARRRASAVSGKQCRVNEPLLEAFCERHSLDTSKVSFEAGRSRSHAPAIINLELTPEDYRIESATTLDAVVVPDTHLVLFVLHPFFNENKKTVRIKTRVASTVQSLVDCCFAAFELPSLYRNCVEYECEGVLIEPAKQGEMSLGEVGLDHNKCVVTRLPLGGQGANTNSTTKT